MTPEEANQTVDAFLAEKLADKPVGPVETKPAEVAVAVITQAEAAPMPKEIELTAEQPQEMEACQRSLIEWCKNKMLSVATDCAELQEAYELAVKNKWKSTTLKRHADKAKHELNYYTKMCGALEAGYVLVPNMPGALFAVKTDKVCPSRTWQYYYWDANKAKSVTALQIGEGDYVAEKNEVREHRIEGTDGKLIRKEFQATDFGELEFPFALSKPRIMEATSRAMALRLFDEFMILPAEAAPTGGKPTVTRQDPIILGIIAMRGFGSKEKKASFMVAWHISTRDL